MVLQAGYFYTFVVGGEVCFSAGGAIGGGLIRAHLLTRFPNENIRNHFTHRLWHAEGHLVMGFQSERFFTGLQVMGRHTEYHQASATNTLHEGLLYQVFVGYRFNAPILLPGLWFTDLNWQAILKIRILPLRG